MADSKVMKLAGKSIAVTGATGFLGRYITKRLLDRGAHVVGVCRRPDRVPELMEMGVEMRKADLADREALTAGFRGCDAIVSNAALFALTNRDWEAHLKTNIDGTRNVLHGARAAGVNRVVHVSSIAVYKGRSGQAGITEDHPKLTRRDRNFFNAYMVSKAVSEAEAWITANELDLELSCVRPSAIYGRNDQNFTRVVRAVNRFPVSVVPVAMTIPLVYAADVAEAIALCLERPISVGKSYNTSSPASARRLLDSYAQAAGRKPWLRIPLPIPYQQVVDSSLAMAELGWEPTPLSKGLSETVEGA